jgi:hypothetical protein
VKQPVKSFDDRPRRVEFAAFDFLHEVTAKPSLFSTPATDAKNTEAAKIGRYAQDATQQATRRSVGK